MAQDRITFRTDSQVKEQASRIASQLGTDTSTILNIFLRAFVREGGMPFSVTLETETAEERAEINRILDERQNLIDSGKAEWLTGEQVKKMVGI